MGTDTYEYEYLHELPILKWDIESGRYVPPVTDSPAPAVYSKGK